MGYIEFAMAGNYSMIGIVQMCNHWAPEGGLLQCIPAAMATAGLTIAEWKASAEDSNLVNSI